MEEDNQMRSCSCVVVVAVGEDLETKSYAEQSKELGMFIMEKRFGGAMIELLNI